MFMRTRTTRTVITMAAVAVLFLAGCGSSDKKDSVATPGNASGGGSLEQTANLSGKVNAAGTKTVTGMSPTLSVDLQDFSFKPTFIKVDPGATIKVSLTNTGKAPHTFTVEGTGVNTELQPGKSGTATVTAPKTGVVAFSCNFHKSMGMQGAFVVAGTKVAAGAGTGSDKTTTTKADSGGYGY
jgi:plastocyanin